MLTVILQCFLQHGFLLNLNREISRLNYRIYTDAIKAKLIPPEFEQGKSQPERLIALRDLVVRQMQTINSLNTSGLPKMGTEK